MAGLLAVFAEFDGEACESGFWQDWLKPGEKQSDWGALKRQRARPFKFPNSIVKGSAKRRSPAGSRSVGRRSGAFLRLDPET
jgi:hypothetical protein